RTGERSEGNDHTELGERAELTFEERQASVPFLGGRPVPRWRASVDRAQVRPAETEAVVHGGGRRPVREPGAMQRREQEITRAIAGEDPPGPVPTMCRGRKPEHQDPGAPFPEPGDRPPPIHRASEAGTLFPTTLH